MSEYKPKEVSDVIKKIPLFKGFSPTQIRLILSQCTSINLEPGEIVCECGQPSVDLFILISGELAVVADGGLRLATISPVTTVGEMGVITGLPRSATVEVTKPTTILCIRKKKARGDPQRTPRPESQALRERHRRKTAVGCGHYPGSRGRAGHAHGFDPGTERLFDPAGEQRR